MAILATPGDQFTIPEAAKLLRRHPETVRRHIREGKLRAYRSGGKFLIRREDLTLNEAYAGPAPTSSAQELDEHIARLVDAAPPLTAGQRARLSALLNGGAK